MIRQIVARHFPGVPVSDPVVESPHDQAGERVHRTIDINGKPENVNDQLFWAGLPGVVGLPGTVAPAGMTDDGLPVGVQIIGADLLDRTTIAFAGLLEREFRAFMPPPGYQ